MDRRNFLLQVLGADPGGRPRTLPGAAAARVLLRPGEPVNAAGRPFGAVTTCLAVTSIPNPMDHRVVVVAGHDAGISAIELVRERAGWRHQVASFRNQRWDLASDGIGAVACSTATPWRTVLCGDDKGVVEVDPWTGIAARRTLFAGTRPRAMRLAAEPGHPVVAWLYEDTRVVKFISATVFDARNASANAAAFEGGMMSPCDDCAAVASGRPETGPFFIGPDGALRVTD